VIEIEETTNLNPKCPHCKTEIIKLYVKEIRGFFGRRYVYFCPECRAVLGISHRKGFWMG
jgi:hypothetical protein